MQGELLEKRVAEHVPHRVHFERRTRGRPRLFAAMLGLLLDP